MGQILRVDEWKSASGNWYVADIHTWTGWDELADVFSARDIDVLIDILTDRYYAIVDRVVHYDDGRPTLIIFHWPSNDYTHAHKFKLDVNRLARQKGLMVD